MSDVILETEGLTKELRGFVAVNGVDDVCVLTFRRGIVGEPARLLRKPL